MDSFDIYTLNSAKGDIASLSPLGENYTKLMNELKTRKMDEWRHLIDNHPDHPYVELLRDKTSVRLHKKNINYCNYSKVFCIGNDDLLKAYCEINNLDVISHLSFARDCPMIATEQNSCLMIELHDKLYTLDLGVFGDSEFYRRTIPELLDLMKKDLASTILLNMTIWSVDANGEKKELYDNFVTELEQISELMNILLEQLKEAKINSTEIVLEISRKWRNYLRSEMNGGVEIETSGCFREILHSRAFDADEDVTRMMLQEIL